MHQKQKKAGYFLNILSALFMTMGMGANAYAAEPANPEDPYEKFNRAMFTFNDKIDIYFLKPVATLYNKIVPRPLNQGIHNFYNNINNLPTIANDVLQLHFYQTVHDFWRLAINTTLGIGGLFDVADRMDLKQHTNDFGLTLARWGYKNSNYLVLPFFGPSTPRDTVGIPVDYFAFSVYPHIHSTTARYEFYGLGIVDRRAQLLKFQSVMEEASYDKYVFVRNAYMQRRNYQIEQNKNAAFKGQTAEEDVPETKEPESKDLESETTNPENKSNKNNKPAEAVGT